MGFWTRSFNLGMRDVQVSSDGKSSNYQRHEGAVLQSYREGLNENTSLQEGAENISELC